MVIRVESGLDERGGSSLWIQSARCPVGCLREVVGRASSAAVLGCVVVLRRPTPQLRDTDLARRVGHYPPGVEPCKHTHNNFIFVVHNEVKPFKHF